MNVAVDQPGRDRRAVGVDDRGGPFLIHILGAPDRGDLAVLGHDRIGVENGLFEIAAEDQTDVADDQLAGTGRLGLVVGHGFFPFYSSALRGDLAILRAA